MVETIETSESVLRVTLTPGDHDYSQLATQLVQEGHRLLHLGEEQIDLETAFMALTKGITA